MFVPCRPLPKTSAQFSTEDMTLLYSLALLLTGDHTMAEQCFLAALDECRKGSNVFPEWTRSWSRRAIIKQAIRLARPMPTFRVPEALPEDLANRMNAPGRLGRLPAFERFVFAMSALEKYSVRECAALLNCRARDVEQSRVRALQLIAGSDQGLGTLHDGAPHAQPAAVVSAG